MFLLASMKSLTNGENPVKLPVILKIVSKASHESTYTQEILDYEERRKAGTEI